MAAVDAQKDALLQQLEKEVSSRWPKKSAPNLQRFLRYYYLRTAEDDLARKNPHDLYGAAISHWRLAEGYAAGKPSDPPRIHVYNPDGEQHGWESTHTIVQIVTHDTPFLVDSVAMALNRAGLTIHLIVHPVIWVKHLANKNAGPQLAEKGKDKPEDGLHLSFMHFEVDRQTGHAFIEAMEKQIRTVLSDVRRAVDDWRPMVGQMEKVIAGIKRHKPPIARSQLDEIVAFLDWVGNDHFTFLGYRCYDLVGEGEATRLERVPDSGLGILRSKDNAKKESDSFQQLPGFIREMARDTDPLILTKSNSRSTVHRPSYMDYIGVKRFNQKGQVIGEHRFLGLYSSAAYNRNPRNIPILAHKLDYVLQKADLAKAGHDGKALLNILETFPRDELFQMDPDALYDTAMGILHLQERQRVRLFMRNDRYRRFVSCLIYAPRDRYNTEVRQRMQAILERALDGQHSEFNVQFGESVLARIHIIVRLKDHQLPEYDDTALEAELAATMRAWTDDLHDALLEYMGEAKGTPLSHRYGEAFSAAYREDFLPRVAAHDVERLEELNEKNPFALSLYRPLEAESSTLRFKMFHLGEPITLSDVLPMLENMGVEVIDEYPYDIQPEGRPSLWIHDFGLRYGAELDTGQVRELFQDTFAAVWRGTVEDDGFNQLSLAARLHWREIVVLRAYSKYLRQTGTALSERFIQQTLAEHPRIARLLVRLFHYRLDPKRNDDKRYQQLREQLELALNDVPGLDQDRVLRRYMAAIHATQRTNFYQVGKGKAVKQYVSFKLIPSGIPDTPKPLPAFEIFVYAPHFEGVHLRGGKVARGGIRWSDRLEDFRTEILGLIKAQMVKNAVIVPEGAKGGFICKQLPVGADRDAVMAEVQRCYKDFMRGLLDITDNRVEGKIVPPRHVVRRDEDDPYLVVAADKGTATFSDMANGVAAEYGFWMRDAFASGGSSGYDHKKMGITARGGWEAVKRHFREMGRNIQSEPFTVIGIGDMSGDVFGNGMLLSKQIKLVAAFDHRHIFIDPDPNPETTFKERERLFKLPRSSWEDYDKRLLSKGGDIYPRGAKSLTVSDETKALLGLESTKLTPNELVRAILRAEVDLLWNGGIGTFIKSKVESHAEVGDKTNDVIRINAHEARCKVIGEGGNLGITQLGRIEFAKHGGRINTDAIDNAGGVDCSDHEVNIKILLNEVVDNGDLTMKQRDKLLADMTEEVAQLVLQSNYRQTQGLSLGMARAHELFDDHAHLMRQLERDGLLDRDLEYLPDDVALAERYTAGETLCRPELAVLLAYAKIRTYARLLADDVVHDPFLEAELLRYFPAPLRERFPAEIKHHRLRPEIIGTILTNHVINRMDSTFFYRLHDRTGATEGSLARAYLAAREIYGLRELWREVDALDNKVPAEVQTRLLHAIQEQQERTTLWMIRNMPSPIKIQEVIDAFRPAVDELGKQLDKVLPEQERADIDEEAQALVDQGVPNKLANRVASMDALFPALDLLPVSRERKTKLETAAQIYFCLQGRLGLRVLREGLEGLVPSDPWEEKARAGLEEELYIQLRMLTSAVLDVNAKGGVVDQVDAWVDDNQEAADRLCRTMNELQALPNPDLAAYAVGVQALRTVRQAGGIGMF